MESPPKETSLWRLLVILCVWVAVLVLEWQVHYEYSGDRWVPRSNKQPLANSRAKLLAAANSNIRISTKANNTKSRLMSYLTPSAL
ncbi:uncharacterized protein LOC143039624 isoform X2 [Oratosquilla oratoria]|uniref:uncharacterized protein LOC143039624 isoform X2 n=1 Tax=Oratosquilla oratoria TaxID=337810 RepID=UPI003F766E14